MTEKKIDIDESKRIFIKSYIVTPQALRAVGVLFSPMVSGWVSRRLENVCLGRISETVRCRKLICGWNIGWGCRCAISWCDVD